MKRLTFYLLFFITGLLIAGTGCKKDNVVSPSETLPDAALPGKNIPAALGFNIHITGPLRDVNRIHESGVKFVRKDLFWNGIEKVRGVYNFAEYDFLVDALEQRGIRILFILCYGNPLYPWPENTEEGRDAYAKFAAEAVRHFKGRNILWEIWNEPNVKHFWRGEADHNSDEFADQYVELVKKAVPAMREADPDCYILAGAVSCLWVNSFNWLDRCLEQGLLSTSVNALSVHPYGFARPELTIEAGYGEGYGYLRRLLSQHGVSEIFPVLNTEVGYDADAEYLGPPELRLEHQAWHFVRQHLVDLMCGIRLTIWYNWNDDHGFRLVNDDMSALPVFTACLTMTQLLNGYHYAGRLATDSDFDYILTFEKEPSERKLVCWTTPHGRDSTPEKAVNHQVSVTVSAGADSVAVYDLYGTKSQLAVNDGKISVQLRGSPQYVDIDREK
ncbi:cellulase family glycosylhydrolase [candidate division KSB1 bacterium]|nr:cellulase family glycosylhydrolase [candidate division KSB1 bacterium]